MSVPGPGYARARTERSGYCSSEAVGVVAHREGQVECQSLRGFAGPYSRMEDRNHSTRRLTRRDLVNARGRSVEQSRIRDLAGLYNPGLSPRPTILANDTPRPFRRLVYEHAARQRRDRAVPQRPWLSALVNAPELKLEQRADRLDSRRGRRRRCPRE